jgi:histidine ammonia-lyase
MKPGVRLLLDEEARQRVEKGRKFLESKMASKVEPVYGINTGFGSLCNVIITDDNLEELQRNLVRSHACGAGDVLPPALVKLMLFLKIRSLCYGNSGVTTALVERLCVFFNLGIYPIVYSQGSLGASGDLAPLAHLSLPLIGEGKVWYQGSVVAAGDVLQLEQLEPLQLQAKEGLAMLNGTQFMAALGCYLLMQSEGLLQAAVEIAALSVDAFYARYEPFHPSISDVRPHPGQRETAARLLVLLQGSEIGSLPKSHVQDPYSFRCIPQVMGASIDMLSFVKGVFTTEINGVTDNPLLFPDQDLIISGGNFHGQPLAMALDMAAIALAEVGSLAERRTYLLISGQRGLPEFLVQNPGLHSGLMIPQYTAASIVSQNKQLCTPASVDSIVSSNGQEDHVSMGANAATKGLKVMENLYTLLAIECITASQALEFRRPYRSSPYVEQLLQQFRKVVPFIHEDRILANDLSEAIAFIHRQYDLL